MPARGTTTGLRRAWDWLHTLARPDETMLARLRLARRIRLHHPAAHREADVLDRWRKYLTTQQWRHCFWLGFNALVTPFATALFILPGPNLIGFWFAYRTVHHGIVVWGISRAQRNQIPIELHAVQSLDQHVEHDDDGNARHAALAGAEEELARHVAWWRSSFLGIPRLRTAHPTTEEKPAHALTRPEDHETS